MPPKTPPPAPITKKKKKWIAQRKPTMIKGDVLNFNASVEERYYKSMERLIRQMAAQTKRELAKVFSSEHSNAFFASDADVAAQARIVTNKLEAKFAQLFGAKAKALSENMVSNVDKTSSSTLHSSLKSLSGGLSIKTTAINAEMKTILKATIAENVGLIKSIPSQYFTQIQGAVMRSITHGNGYQDLVPALKKYEDVTTRRARTIAGDQTRKAYTNLNAGRMKGAGVTHYEWIHTGGSQHPREDHVAMSGQIFGFYENQARDKKTGEVILPSQLINCLCKMKPVIVFNEEPQDATETRQ